jgi:hypothetical protein
MKELDLFRFLKDNDVEMRWDDDQLSTWVSPHNLSELAEMMPGALSEGGIDARLTSYGYVWVDLVLICDYYGIEVERIFPKTAE